MEVLGEFLGLDTDKAIHLYFGRHYPHYFPMVREVHRSTFARQGANLWKAKEHLWQRLLEHELALGTEIEEPLMAIDPFPIPVCKKVRSYRCRVMRDLADRGRDSELGKFLGMRELMS